jgi:hypothetical protein
MLDNVLSTSSIGATKRVHAEARRPLRCIPRNVMLEPKACLHKQVQGDGNIRLRTPIPQNCHSREGGNPWSHISARDTFLVRTKTRTPEATPLCLRAFVRTILPIVRPMDSRFRGNDKSRGSRRGAEGAEGHSPQRHAGAEGVQSTTRFCIHRETRNGP